MSLFVAPCVVAQGDADALLGEVLDKIDECNPYKVTIEAIYGNDILSGYYEVSDDNYYISIDEQELYGDDKVKYEVFNDRKEVVIDHVVPDYNGNILTNPATAFENIRDNYDASLLSDDQHYTILNLKQNSSTESNDETIQLMVDKVTKLPAEIIYSFGSDSIVIRIIKIDPLNSSITKYDSSTYAGYEIIDFR